MKFQRVVHGYRVVDADGSVLGEVYKTSHRGYGYWRVSGTTTLWSTRREAAEYLKAIRP